MVTNWGTNPLLDSFLETTDNNNTGTESDGKLSLAGTLCIVASFCSFILGIVLSAVDRSGFDSYYSHSYGHGFNWAFFVKFMLTAGCFVAWACLFYELGGAVRRLAGAKVTSSPACGVMRVISYLGVFVCLICGCYVLFWLDKEDFAEYFATGVLGNLSVFQIASLLESGIDLATLKILVGLGFIFVAVPCWCAAQFFRGLNIVIGAIDSGTLSVTNADEGSRDWSFEIAKARADKAKAEATIQRLNDKIAELGRKEKVRRSRSKLEIPSRSYSEELLPRIQEQKPCAQLFYNAVFCGCGVYSPQTERNYRQHFYLINQIYQVDYLHSF